MLIPVQSLGSFRSSADAEATVCLRTVYLPVRIRHMNWTKCLGQLTFGITSESILFIMQHPLGADAYQVWLFDCPVMLT